MLGSLIALFTLIDLMLGNIYILRVGMPLFCSHDVYPCRE